MKSILFDRQSSNGYVSMELDNLRRTAFRKYTQSYVGSVVLSTILYRYFLRKTTCLFSLILSPIMTLLR